MGWSSFDNAIKTVVGANVPFEREQTMSDTSSDFYDLSTRVPSDSRQTVPVDYESLEREPEKAQAMGLESCRVFGDVHRTANAGEGSEHGPAHFTDCTPPRAREERPQRAVRLDGVLYPCMPPSMEDLLVGGSFFLRWGQEPPSFEGMAQLVDLVCSWIPSLPRNVVEALPLSVLIDLYVFCITIEDSRDEEALS